MAVGDGLAAVPPARHFGVPPRSRRSRCRSRRRSRRGREPPPRCAGSARRACANAMKLNVNGSETARIDSPGGRGRCRGAGRDLQPGRRGPRRDLRDASGRRARPRPRWIDEDLVVVVGASATATSSGWAKASPTPIAHHYYDGVREATLYVERGARRTGVGRALLAALAGRGRRRRRPQAGRQDLHLERAEHRAGRGLGWREVGVHRRHGTLDGEWKDVLVVEKLLGRPDTALVPAFRMCVGGCQG